MAAKVSLTLRERALVTCYRTTDDVGRRLVDQRAATVAKYRPPLNDPAAASRFDRSSRRLGVRPEHVYALLGQTDPRIT